MKQKSSLIATAGAFALALSLVLGACGGNGASGAQGSGDGGSGSPSVTDEEALEAFTGCMRDNRVPDYPDPVGGLVFDNARDLDADPAVFETAWDECESLLPQSPSGAAGNPAGDAGWGRIVPSGDRACADGSEFAFWERRADPDRVVFYLDGGGVCVDAESCAFTGTAGESDYYNWSLEGEDPAYLGAGSWTWTAPTTRSPTTPSSTWLRALGTPISATSPTSTRRS